MAQERGRQTQKLLDMVLPNGLPIATLELKNPLSGQTVEDAKKQYKKDRDHRELLFEFENAHVHFRCGPRLSFYDHVIYGDKTVFLPFNLGSNPGNKRKSWQPSGRRWRL